MSHSARIKCQTIYKWENSCHTNDTSSYTIIIIWFQWKNEKKIWFALEHNERTVAKPIYRLRVYSITILGCTLFSAAKCIFLFDHFEQLTMRPFFFFHLLCIHIKCNTYFLIFIYCISLNGKKQNPLTCSRWEHLKIIFLIGQHYGLYFDESASLFIITKSKWIYKFAVKEGAYLNRKRCQPFLLVINFTIEKLCLIFFFFILIWISKFAENIQYKTVPNKTSSLSNSIFSVHSNGRPSKYVTMPDTIFCIPISYINCTKRPRLRVNKFTVEQLVSNRFLGFHLHVMAQVNVNCMEFSWSYWILWKREFLPIKQSY